MNWQVDSKLRFVARHSAACHFPNLQQAITKKVKVQHLHSTTSHICCLNDAVRHSQGQRLAKVTTQAPSRGLCPSAIQQYIALVCRLTHIMVSTLKSMYIHGLLLFTDYGGMEG